MQSLPLEGVMNQNKNAPNHEELRPDLQESLAHGHIDPSRLSTFQRIILTTDGTLTEILEAYLYEKIKLVKLAEALMPLASALPMLEVDAGTPVIQRRILLQGKISHRNWVYAESVIVPDRLDERYRERLLKSEESIGRLWLEHRVETFKEIVDSCRETARDCGEYFRILPTDLLLSRTYRVFSHGHPIMLITEKFPETFFLEDKF